MVKVVALQPYVPAYRKDFFDEVVARLGGQEIGFEVWEYGVMGEQRARNDGIDAPWLRRLPSVRRFSLGRISLTSGLRVGELENVSMLILPLEGTSLDIPIALLVRLYRGRPRVALWGHVKNYVSSGNVLDSLLETFYCRRADHVFSYVDSGRIQAISRGVDPQKVTSLQNTISTQSITDALVADDPIDMFRDIELDPARTFCYIGGLDANKRIEFLAEVLDHLWAQCRGFKLIVGGDGSHKHLLEKAVDRGQVIFLGRVDAQQKASIARVSKALLMPGRVGLVAVDALAMSLPVLTTSWRFHAPEIEYLVPGESLFISGNSPILYANMVLGMARSEVPVSTKQPPSLSDMVERYCNGIIQSL